MVNMKFERSLNTIDNMVYRYNVIIFELSQIYRIFYFIGNNLKILNFNRTIEFRAKL